MAESTSLTSLAQLNISENDLSDEGGVALANTSGLPALKTLYMARCGVGDDTAVAFAHAKATSRLDYICLEDNDIHARGNDAMYASEHHVGVEWTTLSNEDS